MTWLVEVAIRSSVVLALGLLAYVCLANRSAAFRHRLLAATLLATVLVAPINFASPAWTVTVPARAIDAIEVVNVPVDQPTSPGARIAVVPPRQLPRQSISPAVLVWLTGTAFAAAALIAALLRVSRVAAHASRVEDEHWLRILDTIAARYGLTRRVVISRIDSANLLATWGVWRPHVLVPRHSSQWTLDRVRVVLSHELAHVRRHDWIVQLGAEAVRAVFWFNPLAWVACRCLRRESEQACDDEVLAAGVAPRDYAGQLLALARECRRPRTGWASAVPMAHPSTLERRIAAMLNSHLDRQIPSRRVSATLIGMLILVLLPVSVLRARQAPVATPAPVVPTQDVKPIPSVHVEATAAPVVVAVRTRPVRGRAFQAPLTGTIYDVTGAVVPGVKVVIEDGSKNTLTATSNATGRFEFPLVNPGKYVLQATLPGFRTLRHDLELNEPRDWNRAITLQVGNLQETITIRESRLPATAPAAPANQPVRVGGNIRAPRKVLDVRPVYPASMREAGLTAVVPLEAMIGPDGTVTSVRVVSAQMHPDFAIAAVDAVRQWKFQPTLLNGVAVEVVMTVTIRFDLEE